VQNILRGTKVDKGTHPWYINKFLKNLIKKSKKKINFYTLLRIAALIDKDNKYFCGGTLISKRLVVTGLYLNF
jgi:hypothetical protein